MNIAPVIFELLKDDDTVAGLVKDRIYPDVAPQNTIYPLIVHVEQNNEPLVHKDAPGGAQNYNISVQLDIYATKFSVAKEIATAVREALDYYTGTIGTIRVNRCHFAEQASEQAVEENESYVISQGYTFKVYG